LKRKHEKKAVGAKAPAAFEYKTEENENDFDF